VPIIGSFADHSLESAVALRILRFFRLPPPFSSALNFGRSAGLSLRPAHILCPPVFSALRSSGSLLPSLLGSSRILLPD
jgi:hypothetical protein